MRPAAFIHAFIHAEHVAHGRSTSAVTVTTVPGLGQASPDAATPASTCEEAATTEVSGNRGGSCTPYPDPTCERAATEGCRGVACPSGDSRCSVDGRAAGRAGWVLARACVLAVATACRSNASSLCARACAPTSAPVPSSAASARVSGEKHSAERAPTTAGGGGGGAAGVLGEWSWRDAGTGAAGADGDGDDEAFLDAGASIVPEVSRREAADLLPS